MNDTLLRRSSSGIRLSALRIVVLFLIVGMGAYLFVLQVFKTIEFEERAERVAMRTSVVPAQRGLIYDRSYTRPIVANRPAFSIDIIPAEVPDGELDNLFTDLGSVFEVDPKFLAGRVDHSQRHLFRKIELLDGVDFSSVAFISERIDHFPGVSWRNKPVRDYSDLGSLSHVIGYVGDITVEELQVLFNQGYQRSDTIGKIGIEKKFDDLLRGNDGMRFRLVDVRERTLEFDEVGRPPQQGHDLVLTIDSRIQLLAERALAQRNGAVVVLRPSTGEVLAMVSYPWFDPSSFRGVHGAQTLQKLSLDSSYPFVNRAIRSAYPPASLFKLIMTAAVLEEGVYSSRDTIFCHGSWYYGGRHWRDHEEKGHGNVNLREALAQSCNIYYYLSGDKLGVKQISSYARDFGLGRLTGIDLPGEAAGFVPTQIWKEKDQGVPWVGGDTVNLSIGQGFITTTPLQIANIVAAIVNGGTVYRPYLVKEVRSGIDGSLVRQNASKPLFTVDIHPETFAFLREAMRYTVTDGTPAVAITTPAVRVSGKTGTAQVRAIQDDEEVGQHSWFAAFAPADAPVNEQIVVVVMAEADDVWEWWAPKVANVLLHSIFTGQDYETTLAILQPLTSMYSLIGEPEDLEMRRQQGR